MYFKQGTQKIALPYSPNQKLTVKQLLTHFPNMDTSKTPKEIFSADIQKDLLLLEEQEGSVNFKFGVVYMKSGQKVDDEMLSNGEFLFTWTVRKRNLLGGALILPKYIKPNRNMDKPRTKIFLSRVASIVYLAAVKVKNSFPWRPETFSL